MSLLHTLRDDAYAVGQAQGLLMKTAGDAVAAPVLSGRLYLSRSGWLLLSVPNGLVRGIFDTLDEEGLELPPGKNGMPYNAHISVMREEEVAQLGGGDAISERGKTFHYQFGPLKEVSPLGWTEMSKVWFVEIKSPELQNLRKSYGLSPLPTKNGQELQFHMTVAVRRKKVLQNNEVKKAAGFLFALAGLKAASEVDPTDPLAQAKARSDLKDYSGKHAILRQHMATHPDQWRIDSRLKNMLGVTHSGGYRFHVPRLVVPSSLLSEGAPDVPT